MKIMLLVTADYASVEPTNKKLTIVGAFDRILTQSFPCTHKRLALAVKIRAEFEDDPGEHTLKVELVDEDGTQLVQISGQFQLSRPNMGKLSEYVTVLELNNFTFPKPGIYDFVVFADDEQLGRTPVELIEYQSPSG